MNPVQTSQASRLKPSSIISTVLSPAVRLWLRSQVERVEDLQVKIEGSDRLLLIGHIPRVAVSARHAVYQGLYLHQLRLIAQQIRINLGQVLKGQPLRLLEPVPVYTELLLQEADLNASLQAPLLANALTELLVSLSQPGKPGNTSPLTRHPSIFSTLKDQQIAWERIEIGSGELTIIGVYSDYSDDRIPIVLRASLQVDNRNKLRCDRLQIQETLGLAAPDLQGFQIDLGPDVDIEELTLSPGQLVCRGRILVSP